jgi:spore coat polysaccharide biosynthesis protein SpsF (cytidylyltransferase family)
MPMTNDDYLIVIQSRMGSSRLPRKMLELIGSDTLFAIVVKRLLAMFPNDKVILATSDNEKDLQLVAAAGELGIAAFRGSEENVFSRFHEIALKNKPKYIVRITGDSPLVDPRLIQLGLKQISDLKLDYVSTTLDSTYPIGVHVEIFDSKLLIDIEPDKALDTTKEHVTPFIYNDAETAKGIIESDIRYPAGRYTVDYECDLIFMRSLVEVSGIELCDFTPSILHSVKKINPIIFATNEGIEKTRLVAN